MTTRAATVAPARRRDPLGTSAAAQRAPRHDLVHRLASNRAISRALAGEAAEPSGVTVGRADDPAERAADRLAAQALGRIDGAALPGSKRAAGTAGASIRRRADDAVVGGEGGDPGPDVAQALDRSRGGGMPLADDVRASFEPALGADLGGVRIHTDTNADSISRQISAEAFTTGRDVYFRSGAYQPGTAHGQHTLAHELAHVVQGGGAVQRAYLDGTSDFAKATTKRTLGIKRARSAELTAIESALYDYVMLTNSTSTEIAEKLHAIRTAIDAWTLTKKDGHAATGVADLRKEVDAELLTLKPDEDAFKLRWARHLKDRAKVQKWIAEGLAQTADVRLHNSCEWIMEGRTKFFVVHEAHDQVARYEALTKTSPAPADARAYFPNPGTGKGDLFSTPVDYDWSSVRSRRNIDLDKDGAGTKGWNVSGKYIVVTEEGVADGKADVLGTIKHETQHDADQNEGAELSAGVDAEKGRKRGAEQQLTDLKVAEAAALAKKKKHPNQYKAAKNAREHFEQHDEEYTLRDARVKMEKAVQGYKTEYRAHFYQGEPRFDSKSHTTLTTKWGEEWTERQWTIFNKIHRNYDYVEEAWGTPKDAAPTGTEAGIATKFRNIVVAYVNPDTEGFNKFNSVRIDDLYRALTTCASGTSDAGNAAVKTVLAVVDRLDKHDVEYLEAPTQSKMLTAKIDTCLTGAAKKAFTSRLAARKKVVSPTPKQKKPKKAGLVNPGATPPDAPDKAGDASDPTLVTSS